ncbi:hypothetical protein LXL04_034080 [Taraxacum kok-saghyz]
MGSLRRGRVRSAPTGEQSLELQSHVLTALATLITSTNSISFRLPSLENDVADIRQTIFNDEFEFNTPPRSNQDDHDLSNADAQHHKDSQEDNTQPQPNNSPSTNDSSSSSTHERLK